MPIERGAKPRGSERASLQHPDPVRKRESGDGAKNAAERDRAPKVPASDGPKPRDRTICSIQVVRTPLNNPMPTKTMTRKKPERRHRHGVLESIDRERLFVAVAPARAGVDGYSRATRMNITADGSGARARWNWALAIDIAAVSRGRLWPMPPLSRRLESGVRWTAVARSFAGAGIFQSMR